MVETRKGRTACLIGVVLLAVFFSLMIRSYDCVEKETWRHTLARGNRIISFDRWQYLRCSSTVIESKVLGFLWPSRHSIIISSPSPLFCIHFLPNFRFTKFHTPNPQTLDKY
ncbi:hypothetical protein L1887_07234 [Cichorium endivia]|nr:hypothetical protein L1887_07234 [Cichorium endivia]